MTKPRYAKLKGDAWRNPKLAGLSDAAFRLWINCVSYCADNLTDGEVPAHILPALLPTALPLDVPLAELLDEPGLLLRQGQVYVVAKYLAHNVSRDEIEKHSQMQRKKAEKRWANKKKKEADPPPSAAGNTDGNAKYKYKHKHKNKDTYVDGPGWTWVVRQINIMHREIFKTDWFGYAKFHGELDQFAQWASQQAEADGVTREEAVQAACRGWSEDAYVVEQSYGPLPLIWRKAAQYYLAGNEMDVESKKVKLETLTRLEEKAYKEGNHEESARLQQAIAELR